MVVEVSRGCKEPMLTRSFGSESSLAWHRKVHISPTSASLVRYAAGHRLNSHASPSIQCNLEENCITPISLANDLDRELGGSLLSPRTP